MADEPNFNAALFSQPQRGTGIFGRPKPLSGAVSASMRIEVPGLRQFKTELKEIRSLLAGMRSDFERLSPATGTFNRLLSSTAGIMRGIGGGGGVGAGAGFTAGRQMVSSAGQGGAGAGMGGGGGGGMPGGAPGGMGGMLGLARSNPWAAAAAAATFGVVKGAELAADRFTTTRDLALSTDSTASRLALANGIRIPAVRQGMMAVPILGTTQERYDAAGTMLNVGLGSGARGAVAAQNIATMQSLMPGTSAVAIAQSEANYYSNVDQRRFASMMLGISAYGPGGRPKDINTQFGEALSMLERRAGKTFTAEDLSVMQQPGSATSTYIAALGWDAQRTTAFFDWARAKVQYTGPGAFTASPDQMERLRGTSQAYERAVTTSAEAARDETLIKNISDAYLKQEEVMRALIKTMQDLDSTFQDVIAASGNAPRGAEKVGSGGNIVRKALGGGSDRSQAYGYNLIDNLIHGNGISFDARTGDPGGSTSHLSPDLRSRVDAMMAESPGLFINSAYRSTVDQAKLYATGNPNVAPPGKSKHAHGRAVDIGGSNAAMAWMQKHAGRFGLETASKYGEPWHVQLAGSTFIGDAQADRERESFLRNVQLQYIMGVALNGGRASGAAASPGSGVGTSATTAPASGTLDVSQVVQAAYNAGFRGEDLVTAVAIANRESGWRADAYNGNRGTGDDSYGLWQINMLGSMGSQRAAALGISSYSDLNDPSVNARAAFMLYQQSGNSFHPWGGYKGESNTYNVSQGAFDAARQAARAAGYIGDVYGRGGGGGGQIVFHNSFQVTVGGSGGNGSVVPGIEDGLKRAAAKMEGQVRRAVSRRD